VISIGVGVTIAIVVTVAIMPAIVAMVAPRVMVSTAVIVAPRRERTAGQRQQGGNQEVWHHSFEQFHNLSPRK